MTSSQEIVPAGPRATLYQEKKVMAIFNKIKKQIHREIGHKNATLDSELTVVGKKLFGNKYTGTFTVDHKPNRRKKDQYFIINNQGKNQPGEHWIAVCKQGDLYYIYDSFGRASENLIPSFVKNKKYFDSDRDAEQNVKSSVCGGLCLAWLCVFDRLGKENAMLI